MATGPNCKYEFFEYKQIENIEVAYDETLVHECVSGYLRSYPVRLCGDCFKAKSEYNVPLPRTTVMKRAQVHKKNYLRKLRHFREMNMESQSLVAEPEEGQEAQEA